MTAPDKIWIAGPASECGHYYPNATEAEGEHGGQAVEYTRSDLIAASAVEVKPLDLSNMLKHAFIAGRISAGASSSFHGYAWAEYDPTESAAYARILSALHPASPLGAVMEVPEVRALVEALTPFDAVSIEMFSRNYNASDIVLTVGPVSGTCLTFRDFLNVRAALAPFARKGE